MNASIRNESYGSDERNVFDLYLADSDHPTPLLFFIHSGAFMEGDKDEVLTAVPVEKCLEAGISVATIHHRFTDVASFPTPMHDAAYALQYIRFKAKQWNIAPTRIGACGVSSGSGVAQWLGFHPDLAEVDSDNPILRQSTKVSCVIPLYAQSTYDLRVMRKIVPGLAPILLGINRLFGLSDNFNWDTDELTLDIEDLIQECGPITLLSKDAPPVLVWHRQEDEKLGDVHHPNFGRHLEAEMKKVGATCIRRLDIDYGDPINDFNREFIDFLTRYLTVIP